jgi:hypothetical protein
VVVAGGVSAMVVVVGVVPVGDWSSYGPEVPSTPVDGCGGAWPVAAAEGVSLRVCGGFETSGGAFW